MMSVITLHANFAGALRSQNLHFKFEGEYGLWVQERNGKLEFHWITAAADSGFLQVVTNGVRTQRFTTPFAQAHRVDIASTQSKSLVIEYGGLSQDAERHQTTVYLDPKRSPVNISNVDSIFVVSDIHGQFDNLVQLLTNAKLIDSNLSWIARRNHLVIIGDIFDRGPDVTRTLWFLHQLEGQAERSGGRLHLLLGNHEIMTFCNDVRYLSGKEKSIAELYATDYTNMFDIQNSILGRWLASKPGILKVDAVLFAHGGITPAYTGFTIESFNDTLFKLLHENNFKYLLDDSIAAIKMDSVSYGTRLLFFFDDNSVFWYRGYVVSDSLDKELTKALKKFKSAIHVVGHTPVPTISAFYDGRLVAVNTINFASEMLLLVRTGKKHYVKFKYNLNGEVLPVERDEDIRR